jgi:hypothetical protein
MASVSKTYPSPWPHADDLQGMQRKVRIDKVEMREDWVGE